MQNNRRRIIAGSALLGAVAIVLAGWFWARPWWQERSLTTALRDISGVASVESTTKDHVLDEHPFIIRFADDVTGAELVTGTQEIEQVLDDHEIAGDRAGVALYVDDFELVPNLNTPFPEELLQAVAALRQVDGLTGIQADPGEVTMSVRADADLMPVATRALEALVDAKVESFGNTALRYVVEGGGAQLRTSLGDATRQLPLLRQIEKATSAADVIVDPQSHPSPSIQLFAGRGSAEPTCSVELRLGPDADFAAAAKTLVREGPDCITLATEEDSKRPFSLRLDHEAGLGAALDLRDEVLRAGATLTRTDTILSSVDIRMDESSALEGLLRLTRDPARWTVPASAPLTLQTPALQTIVTGQPVKVLHEVGPLLADIGRAGFLAYVRVGRNDEQTIGISDDTAGSADLTTEAGQELLARTIRASAFSGSRQFAVSVDGDPYGLRFSSTATGEARSVQEPSQSSGSWAYQVIEAWNASAR